MNREYLLEMLSLSSIPQSTAFEIPTYPNLSLNFVSIHSPLLIQIADACIFPFFYVLSITSFTGEQLNSYTRKAFHHWAEKFFIKWLFKLSRFLWNQNITRRLEQYGRLYNLEWREALVKCVLALCKITNNSNNFSIYNSIFKSI